MKIIRIQQDELEQIIHDRLIKYLKPLDTVEVITQIMEDVSKSNPFKVWRR